MVESRDTWLHKLLFFFFSTLVIINLILLLVRGASIASPVTGFANTSNDPNVVAGDMAVVANNLGHTADMTAYAIKGGVRSVTMAATQSVRLVGSTVQDGATYVGRSVIGGMAVMAHATSNIVGFVSDISVINTVIRPVNETTVPVIKSLTITPAIQTASQTISEINSAPQWPIHGVITTLFGVPDLPYERIHTGLDISDGKPPGTTPILPFRPGLVIEIVPSNFGLGNHIVIDHGGGITSVYGHLYSIAVQIGQQVNEDTILGYEGTTGASTGTHLHFEIRINDQPVNPLHYISGNP